MEGKKSTGLIVLVVIMALIIVGLAGFMVYDKVLKEDTKVEEKTSSNEKEKNSSEEKNVENSYEIYAKKLKEEMNSKYNDNNYDFKYVKNEFVPDGYSITLNNDGDLYISYNNKELHDKYGEYKIASNVLNFYLINVGQDFGNMLYYINEDGTVSSANIEYGVSNGTGFDIKNNIDNLKDIVSIQDGVFGATESGAHGPIFIDINGNIYGDNLN